MSGDVAVGWWYSVCCIEDLYEIADAMDLADVEVLIADMDDPEEGHMLPVHVWATKEEALADPMIAPEVERKDYSNMTAERLGLPPPDERWAGPPVTGRIRR